MGADGGLIAASLLAPVVGSIFAPDGQELSSFEGKGAIDPSRMMLNAEELIGALMKTALADAAKPTTINTTVAPLPTFTGGGLPMTIAAPATDPNRTNPTRRQVGGMDLSQLPKQFGGGGGFAGERSGRPPGSPGSAPGTGSGNLPGEDGSPKPPDPVRPDMTLSPFADMTLTSDDVDAPSLKQPLDTYGGDVADASSWMGDDADQATGAVELLLAQLKKGSNGGNTMIGA